MAGLVLSLSGGRLISNVLYDVPVLDPETDGGVLLLILLVATVATAASLIPAWHSAQAEPTRALRQQ